MFRNVVVAVDGSRCADHALELALQLAKVEDSALAVCCIADTSALIGSAQFAERAYAELYEEARRVLDEATSKVKAAGVAVRGCVLEGEPAHQIVTYAKKINADAIVIGTHGRSGVNRLLMGSVAEGVLRSASMPVLTVRAEARLAPLASEVVS